VNILYYICIVKQNNMKKILLNNYSWFIDMTTSIIYEFEDKSGVSFKMGDKGITQQERIELRNQILYIN
jgi:hypothetical protein